MTGSPQMWARRRMQRERVQVPSHKGTSLRTPPQYLPRNSILPLTSLAFDLMLTAVR